MAGWDRVLRIGGGEAMHPAHAIGSLEVLGQNFQAVLDLIT